MKKKCLLVLALLVVSMASFASSKDKLGVYIGRPISLSYSHEFNNLMELDLLAGWWGFLPGTGALEVYLGLLFTMIDGSVGGHPWALTFGPSLGGTFGFIGGFWGTLDILADLRWEIDFKTVKGFNFFLDFAPGVSVQFNTAYPVWYTFRGGVGLRYRFQ